MPARSLRPVRPALLTLTALCVASTTGCGFTADETLDTVFSPCAPLRIVPDPDTRPEELEAIEAGLALWRAVLPIEAELAEAPLTPDDTPVLPVTFRRGIASLYGVYADEEGRVLVNRVLDDPEERALTVAHELGHAFGLWHVRGRRSVMNTANLAVPPQPADAAEVAAAWPECGWVEMPSPSAEAR